MLVVSFSPMDRAMLIACSAVSSSCSAKYRSFGSVMYEYITDQKLRYFAEQLEETDEQVINIALSMGENDTKSISRRFKQLYGCTPVEWRENKRKKES